MGRAREIVTACARAAAVAAAGCGLARAPARERAREAWVEADYETSAAAYEEFLAGSPEGPEAEEAELQLADIYYHNLKLYDRARDRYVMFLGKYPGSPRAYEARQRLAEVYVELKALPEAIAQYEQLLAERPDTPDRRRIRSEIANLYFERNDHAQAELEYLRVVEGAEYDELSEQALLRLASIYHRVRKTNEQALPIYGRLAESTPDPVVRRNALYGLTDAYAEMFRFDEAIATLKRIDDPAEADYVARRAAELERQKKDHAEAPAVDWTRGKGEGG
jgi:tetratricopeptide (TPR) repeat protein